MPDIKGLVKQIVEEKMNQKVALLVLEVKELKQEVNELRKKNNLLHSRVRTLEVQGAGGTDYGV